MTEQNTQPVESFQLSLRWVVLGLIILLSFAFLGGITGSYFWQTPGPLLTGDDRNQLITTVQEVTISPSRAASDLVRSRSTSILLLGIEHDDQSFTAFSNGFVMTSDGLVASLSPRPNVQADQRLVAYDGEAGVLPISFVGSDVVYGISYYRLEDGVLPPLELAASDPEVGSTHLEVARSSRTFEPVAMAVQIIGYRLPEAGALPGISRVPVVSRPDAFEAFGAPRAGLALLDDEGSVVGLTDLSNEDVRPVSALRASLNRITTNQREVNVFEELGMDLVYATDPPGSGGVVRPRVRAVTASLPASAAGVKVNDIILGVNQKPVDWLTALPELLTGSEIALSVRRGESTLELTLRPR